MSLPFCLESTCTLYVFLPDGAFQLCDHGLNFDIGLLMTFLEGLSAVSFVLFV